jgi:nucleoside phosphorylase
MLVGHWITAATRMEMASVWNAIYPDRELPVQPTLTKLKTPFPFSSSDIWCLDSKGPWFSVTGPGLAQSLLRGTLGVTEMKPLGLWQFGIAGAYERSGLSLGETVCVVEECLGDLGLEWPSDNSKLPASYRSMHEQPWADSQSCGPWALSNPMKDFGVMEFPWKTVRGVTVNEVTGTEFKGRLRGELWRADVETMEGAAAALLGKHFHIPTYQIRTISNVAGQRNWTPTGLEMALTQLARSVAALSDSLKSKGA